MNFDFKNLELSSKMWYWEKSIPTKGELKELENNTDLFNLFLIEELIIISDKIPTDDFERLINKIHDKLNAYPVWFRNELKKIIKEKRKKPNSIVHENLDLVKVSNKIDGKEGTSSIDALQEFINEITLTKKISQKGICSCGRPANSPDPTLCMVCFIKNSR